MSKRATIAVLAIMLAVPAFSTTPAFLGLYGTLHAPVWMTQKARRGRASLIRARSQANSASLQLVMNGGDKKQNIAKGR